MVTRVVASLIGLKPEFSEQYVALHAHAFPEVLARLARSNIRHYSIFLHDGVLFSYYEHVGVDYGADMAAIGTDAATRQWWTLTDQMQDACPWRAEGEWWATIPEIKGVVELGSGRRTADAVSRLAFIGTAPAPVQVILDGRPREPLNVLTLHAFQSPTQVYVYCEVVAGVQAESVGRAVQRALGLAEPPAAMTEVFHSVGAARKKVFVSGCFDMLHSGHVAFLREASTYGDLYVGIGSDSTIYDLKGRYPVNSQEERKYMIDALECVTGCCINRGSGLMDFEPELDDIRPEVLILNEDGHTPSKEPLCREKGIEYLVLRRTPPAGLPARSTTSLRSECRIPFRIDLAGGWLDQPYVSALHPGSVLTISIEPTEEFNDRSGMASSTRRKAIALWQNTLPHGDPEHLAKVLFSFENPPGTQEVAGSQDSLGIVLPGLNRLIYDGGYWPAQIDSVHDEDVLSWIEQHLCLLTLGPRASTFRVLDDTNITPTNARALAEAAEACWEAILARDARGFGLAFRRSFEAQVAMFPKMVDEGILQMIDGYRDRAFGWKLSGAGGGGYLILVSANPPTEGRSVRIRRRGSL